MNSSSNLHPYAGQSYSQTLLVNIIRIVFGVFAISGNGFVLYIISTSRKIRKNLCNLLIGILAFADFCTGIGFFFGSSVTLGFQLLKWHNYTNGHCLLVLYMGMTGIQMSQVATVFIALDRLKAVQDPMFYSTQDRIRRFVLALSITLVYSFTTTALIFFGVNLNEHPTICQAGSILHPNFIKYWHLFAFCIAAVIVACYAATSHTLTNKLAYSTSEQFHREIKKQKVVFKTISIILAIYGLCWCLPNFVILIATLLKASPVIMGKLTPLVGVGTSINSSANVVVYAWKHREFGSAMRNALSANNVETKMHTIPLLYKRNETATI